MRRESVDEVLSARGLCGCERIGEAGDCAIVGTNGCGMFDAVVDVLGCKSGMMVCWRRGYAKVLRPLVSTPDMRGSSRDTAMRCIIVHG